MTSDSNGMMSWGESLANAKTAAWWEKGFGAGCTCSLVAIELDRREGFGLMHRHLCQQLGVCAQIEQQSASFRFQMNQPRPTGIGLIAEDMIMLHSFSFLLTQPWMTVRLFWRPPVVLAVRHLCSMLGNCCVLQAPEEACSMNLLLYSPLATKGSSCTE